MTAVTLRPLTPAERRTQDLDGTWRLLTAELAELDWCPHLFRYRDGCRRCQVNASIDRIENELAVLSGFGPPNHRPTTWQGEHHAAGVRGCADD